MSFLSDFVNTLLAVSESKTFQITDVHGVTTTHSDKQLHQVVAAAPAMASGVKVVTLAGFAELIRTQLDGKDFPADYLIHIEDERTVVLKSRCNDGYGRRQVLAKAEPVPFKAFSFGQWMDQEAFAIAVASLFADTPEKTHLLDVASSMTMDASTTSEDNGFVQKVIVKAGLRTKESVTLEPKIALAPFRTFPEVRQPVSEFVFRAKADGDSRPMFMLIEADGGSWKVDAINELRRVMDGFDLKVPIIA